jgi:hypothetical protein
MPYKKSLKSFMQGNSCPLYRVSNTTECFGSKHSAQLPFLPSVICVLSVGKRNTHTITFSTEYYLCTECRQMKHLVQCYFTECNLCTECLRWKNMVQCSFLPSVLLMEHSTWVGPLLTCHQEAICTECFFILLSVFLFYQVHSDKLLCVPSAR